LILHGGDLVHGGPGSPEIVDQVRELGWPGVLGNTDEMLFNPESLKSFASQSPAPAAMWAAIEEMAAADRAALGEARLEWLRSLPLNQNHGPIALVHASPASAWRAPAPEADDAELKSVYGPLGRPVAVYAHIHRPFIRSAGETLVVNTGSVGLSFDGDPRAAYLLLDERQPVIRRVGYDVAKEIQALTTSAIPHADWIIRILQTARPQMP
jgi:diadenosine tetraphosphatase ApaH/serine/threonine PP2A family protein phosphatase